MSAKRKLTTKNSRKTLKKVKILNEVSRGGKIFGVEFIKKDGSLRKMSCRKNVTKGLKGGSNTVSHLPEYTTVYSMNDKGYRNVSIPNIRKIKGCATTYNF